MASRTPVPMFFASKLAAGTDGASSPAGVVLLQSRGGFTWSDRERRPRVCLTLCMTEVRVTVHGKPEEGVRIPLWELLHARAAAGAASAQLELLAYGPPATARGGCWRTGGTHEGIVRRVVRLTAATKGGTPSANAELVRSWATVLQHAALGTLPPVHAVGRGGGGGGGQAGADDPTPAPHPPEWAHLLHPPTRQLLVYVNPAAGPGKAVERFDAEARPLFEDAGMQLDVRLSTRPTQATEELLSMPWTELREYTGVLAVGGDGSLSEIVNGIMGRLDWARVVETLPLGVLPAGSGNGLALSLLHAAGMEGSIAHAAHLVAKGAVTRMDVASTFVQREACAAGMGGAPPGVWGHRRWQFLSTEWAIVADIDLESERLRWLGTARFDVYGAIRGLALRKYKGRFCYLPAEAENRSGRRWNPQQEGQDAGEGRGAHPATAPRLPAAGRLGTSRVSVTHDGESGGVRETADAVSGEEGCVGRGAHPPEPLPTLRHLPPFDVPVPLSWRTIEGTFTFLWVTNTSHQSAGVVVSPTSRHSDGVMTVTLIRDTGPVTMLRALLSLEGGVQRVAGVETFHCLAWRLEPEHRGAPLPVALRDTADPALRAGHGHVAVDGEPVPYGPIQTELHPGLLRVFGPGSAGHEDSV